MGLGALVTVAVLASAVLHASWNALAHRVPEPMAAMTLIGLGMFALSVPLLLVVPTPVVASWRYLGASLGVHLTYVVLLARSYRLGDFGQVYPMARGTSPLVVTLVAALFLGERLSGLGLAGVLGVCAGLAVLVWRRSGSGDAVEPAGRGSVEPVEPAGRGSVEPVEPAGRGSGGPVHPAGRVRRSRRTAALVAAGATGLSISAYTVVDGAGVRVAGEPLGYSVWLLAGVGLGMVCIGTVVYRRRLPSVLGGRWWMAPVGGALSWASYALVLWAQARGALGAVAALRETSVIVAAVIGTLVFGEPFGRQRILATVLVATGIVLINV